MRQDGSHNGLDVERIDNRGVERVALTLMSAESLSRTGEAYRCSHCDLIRMAHANEYDVALVFTQDQDLSEAVDEI